MMSQLLTCALLAHQAQKTASTKWKHMPLTVERVKDFVARGIHNPEKYVQGLQKGFDEVTRKRGIEVLRLTANDIKKAPPDIGAGGGYSTSGLDSEQITIMRGIPKRLYSSLYGINTGSHTRFSKNGLDALDAVSSQHELGEAMALVRQKSDRLNYHAATNSLSGKLPNGSMITDGVGQHFSPRILMNENRHLLLAGQHEELDALKSMRHIDSFSDGFIGASFSNATEGEQKLLSGLQKSMNARRAGGGTSEYAALRAVGWKEGDPAPRGRKLKKMMTKFERGNSDYVAAANALIDNPSGDILNTMGTIHAGVAKLRKQAYQESFTGHLLKTAYVESMVPGLISKPATKKFIEKQINKQIKEQIQAEVQRSLMADVSGSSGQVGDDREQNAGSDPELVPVNRRD